MTTQSSAGAAEGLSLAALIRKGSLPVLQLVLLGRKLAEALCDVHRAGGVHRKFCPANIQLSAAGEVLLGDSEEARVAGQETGGVAFDTCPLEYISPEQTGRTAHDVDHRSDLYSLGATLYELATGAPPFGRGDPLRLIHDHLVREPTAPRELRPELPEALSAMIVKLLAKEPAQRYQSAEGLARDLARQCTELQSNITGGFALGERDFPVRLSAPARLSGRHQETAALVDALDAAVAGRARGVLITGPAGVGKTALANELRRSVARRGGWFVDGKFDASRRDRQADGFYQAMRSLGRLLLVEPEQELVRIRARVLGALGPSLARTMSRYPEIGLLLGVEGDSSWVDSPQANQLRSESIMAFLRVLASPARPLVIVLDDLQWAESRGIERLHGVLTDDALRGLLVVGIYRDAELDPRHPLATRLPEWARLPMAPKTIELRNLPAEDLSAMLGEMLRLPPADAMRLADAIGGATGGNPFDAIQLLDGLRREGALTLADEGWSWDERVIRRHIGHSSVTELLIARVGTLPQETRQLIEVMACLGGAVTVPLLEVAAAVAGSSVLEHLAPALDDGLIVAAGDEEAHFAFRHQRVQQAVLEWLGGAQAQVHLAIAQRLEGRPEFRTVAAQQYIPVLEAIAPRAEQLRVAQLLEDVGKDVRGDDVAAESCLVAAIRLHRLAGAAEADLLPLHALHHALLYGLGRLDEMGPLYGHIETLAHDPLDLAESACMQIRCLTRQARTRDAVVLGQQVMERLDFPLPSSAEVAASLQDANVFRRWQDPAVVSSDMNRPDASDPRALAAGSLITHMMAPSALCDAAMHASLVVAGHHLWVVHGPAPQFIESVSSGALLSISACQDYRTGNDMVRAVLRISEARGYPEAAIASFLWVAAAAVWHTPMQEVAAEAQRILKAQIERGELQTPGLLFYCSAHMALDCASIDQWADGVEAALAHCRRTGNRQTGQSLLPHRQLARMLRGETDAFGSFDDGSFNTEAHASLIADFPAARMTFLLMKALAAALEGDRGRFLQHAAEANAIKTHVLATYTGALCRVLHALALAQNLHDRAHPQREGMLAQLDACIVWLAARAADAPFNFQHLLRWVEAERAWAQDEFEPALRGFDEAQHLAAGQPRPWHQALLAERAATLLLERGVRVWGERNLTLACERYAAWGAAAKVQRLHALYPFLASPEAAPGTAVRAAAASPGSDSIDLLGVLRASQALSSNTSLASLKNTIVELLGAMTGATSVQLALYDGTSKQWLLSAASGGSQESVTVEAAAARRLLPISAFQYAQRTLEPLVVEDAVSDPRFGKDPYFSFLKRCALLVLPIVSQGTPRAMLLLANHLSSGAFRGERLETVLLIAGQLAVSLENALVYEGLEQRVQDRTGELEAAQAQLVDTARRAGMAEVATNVLHNVGNVLNSVNVSANSVTARLRGSRVQGLARAANLIQAQAANLGNYLTLDDKGKLLPGYLVKAIEAIEVDRDYVIRELGHLTESVEHIKNIVATQQMYAGAFSMIEQGELSQLVEDALRIHARALQAHSVVVRREFADLPVTELDKTRVMQIVVNLIGNAVQAMEQTAGSRDLTLRLEPAGIGVRLSVADAGVGIPAENLTRMFSHGFTTRRTGHGFGLHSCALAAREMGGTLVAASEGPGRGAVFTLELPVVSGRSEPEAAGSVAQLRC